MPPIVEPPHPDRRVGSDGADALDWDVDCLVVRWDTRGWMKVESAKASRRWDVIGQWSALSRRTGADASGRLKQPTESVEYDVGSAVRDETYVTTYVMPDVLRLRAVDHAYADMYMPDISMPHDALKSPGYAYMRVGAAVSACFMIVAVLVVAEASKSLGLMILWLAGAVFFFCNFAAERLGYPYPLVGPAVSMFASFGCILLAITVGAAAMFD